MIPAYVIPASDELQAVYYRRYGALDAERMRHLAAMAPHDMPIERQNWLIAMADRLEASEYATFSDIPAARFDELAVLDVALYR